MCLDSLEEEKAKRIEQIISSAGLFHADWNCIFENSEYLYLKRAGEDPAEIKIIDKARTCAV